jgi:hypothetical protein
MVLNLRSAGMECRPGRCNFSAHWKNSAAAEECAQRLERIVTAARLDGLQAQAKSRRPSSPLRDDLAMVKRRSVAPFNSYIADKLPERWLKTSGGADFAHQNN